MKSGRFHILETMQQKKPGYKEKIILLGVPLFFIAAYIYPFVSGDRMPLCAFHFVTDLSCPGCGVTRALAAFIHGDFQSSINYNPMGIVIALLLVVFWLQSAYLAVVGKSLGLKLGPASTKIIALAFIVGLFVQWAFFLIDKYVL